MDILLEINKAHLFLYSQLELIKYEFSQTDDNRLLKKMDAFNHSKNVLRNLENAYTRVSSENRDLRKEVEKLRQINS